MFKPALIALSLLLAFPAFAEAPKLTPEMQKQYDKFACPNQAPPFPTDTDQFRTLGDFYNVVDNSHYIFVLDTHLEIVYEVKVNLDENDKLLSRCLVGVGKLFEPAKNNPKLPEEKKDENAL